MNGRTKESSGSDLTSLDSDGIELEDLEASHLDELRTTQYELDEDIGRDEDGLLGSNGSLDGIDLAKEYTQIFSRWGQVRSIVVESAPTLLLTTVGVLLTGELLNHVSQWKAMRAINELIMIIPVILNLKGNLEMNLSARLGTSANMGDLDDPNARRKIIYGNLALLQVQATIFASVAACISMILGTIVPDPPQGAPSLDGAVSNSTMLLTIKALRPFPTKPGQPQSGLVEFIVVAAAAMLSACLSSILLGSFMCTLVVLCRHFGRDPDNIAPPVASCLGDLVTLFLLGTVSSALVYFVNTPLPLVLVSCLILFAISCAFVVRRNSDVKDLIWQGWLPLLGAMVISSVTGIILDIFASRYQGFPLLAIVISGLPGSVGSILVSRLSTALHATKHSAHMPEHARSKKLVMLTLFLVTVPIQIIFLATLHTFGWVKLPTLFAILLMLFFCCAVAVSLFIADGLTNYLWSRSFDPDMYALPIHSAMMDLVGQLLLVLCFQLVSLMGIRLES